MDKINRLKAVLAETGHTGKWLAEQLDKDPATVSKWCTNTIQPDLKTLIQIANLLNINVRELLENSIDPIAKKATKKEDKALSLEAILLNCRDYLCDQLGIPLGTHHRAGDDAEMCARLYLRELQDMQ